MFSWHIPGQSRGGSHNLWNFQRQFCKHHFLYILYVLFLLYFVSIVSAMSCKYCFCYIFFQGYCSICPIFFCSFPTQDMSLVPPSTLHPIFVSLYLYTSQAQSTLQTYTQVDRSTEGCPATPCQECEHHFLFIHKQASIHNAATP